MSPPTECHSIGGNLIVLSATKRHAILIKTNSINHIMIQSYKLINR